MILPDAVSKFVIRGKAIAELRPLEVQKRPLERGCAANSDYRMSADFDEALEDLADYM